MRQALAVVLAAAAAGLGAVIAGEYDLGGVNGALTGAVLGVLVAEILAGLAGRGDAAFLAVAAVLAAAASLWAGWISAGRSLERAPTGVWAGAALAAVMAPVWLRSAARRGERSAPRS